MPSVTDKKLRVYCNTNAPFATSGYANQASQIVFKWQEAGYNTAVGCFYGLEGGMINLNGVTFYPKIADTWGADMMIHHAADFKADVTFSLQDIWVLDPNALRQVKRWIPIVPVDHDPVPMGVYDRLKLAYRVVTFSKFGDKELSRLGIASTYIPYGLDTDTFSPQDRNASRKELGIPEDLYLFGMVAANKDNPPRKSFQEVIDAFAIFNKLHPQSGMYFHVYLEQPGGFNIMQYWKFKGLPMDKLFFTPTYIQMFKVDRPTMAKIISTFNCLVNPSTNGGLEATLIEGQAMGLPVIGTDWTAMSELVIPGKTGELVKRVEGPNGLRYSPLGSYVAIPDTRDLYNCMEKVFKYDMSVLAAVCRANAVDNYDAKMVVEKYWLPYFQMLEKEIYPQQVDSEKNAT